MTLLRRDLKPGTCPTSLRSPEPIYVVSAHSCDGQGYGTETTDKPDFDRLRAERDASLECIAREMWETLGGNPDEAPTFHCREYHSPCYCACPDGPCEHHFEGWREFEDGLGGEQFCERCGEGAMSHSMRFLP